MRLLGGITSSVHACLVERTTGPRQTVVLRRWTTPVSEDAEAPERVRREAGTLAQLAATGVPAPELIALDPDGVGNDGVPALLMTRLPGRIDLTPADPQRWLGQLAAMLPVIHSAPVEAPTFDPWIDPPTLTPPAWSRHPDLWAQAIRLVRQQPSGYRPTFLHRDFQHFNVLWSRGRLTGVIDWVEASTGPPDIDVGHCRLNLAVLFAPQWAQAFLERYEVESGRIVDPYWDLVALLGYLPGWGSFIQVQAGSRAVLDKAGMHGRVDALLSAAMRRV